MIVTIPLASGSAMRKWPMPRMARTAQFAAGWHICLDVADRLLAGDPVPVIRGAEAKKYGWQDLADAYAARLDLKEEV